MPELPEVEVLKRSLEPHLPGETISGVEVRSPGLREPFDTVALEGLAGHTVTELSRRAKYLRIHLSGGRTLVVHLGMSGRLTMAPGDAPDLPHEHLTLRLASGRKLRLQDPRRFGMAFVVPTDVLDRNRHFSHLGLEPFAPTFDGGYLADAAQGRRGPVKTFLMNGGLVVGVGNIYASEALHRAGIHPRRSVARIARKRWDRLAEAVVTVLRSAVEQGGTTLNDFSDGDGNSGYFQVSLAVYDREGQPCASCDAPVRRIVQSNRATYYCPRCQR